MKQLVPASLRRWLQSLLARIGYQLVRLEAREEQYEAPTYDASTQLPNGATDRLRADHPRLAELRERYAAVDLPMSAHSLWGREYLDRELDLRWFRGDNPYVWLFRNVGSDARRKYYLYLRDLAARDSRELLRKLDEDGAFGCWTFDYAGWPKISRDLLDAINELYFLDRQLELFSHPEWTVLDIGAGYGRLAHRATRAVPGLSWLCTDAVPESTFLCEFYLQHRQCAGAEVIPLDELETRLSSRRIDLAVNVHSFSEMSERAVTGWLDLLARYEVPRLFIVPNEAQQLLTQEEDRSRRAFDHVLAARGYQRSACEPVFPDPAMPQIMDVSDHFLLYERKSV